MLKSYAVVDRNMKVGNKMVCARHAVVVNQTTTKLVQPDQSKTNTG